MKDSITQDKLHNRIRRSCIIAVWIILWQLASLKIQNDIFLPGPASVVHTLAGLLIERDFWYVIGSTLGRISYGFCVGFLGAILLGGVACRFRWIREFIAPIISMIKSIPVASFIILVLVWFSSKQLASFISFLVTFPIIYISVVDGFSNVNRELLEMTEVYHVKFWTKIRYLYLSEILPFVTSSAKVAVGMCWKAGISGEIIGLPKHSIGEQLYLSKLYLDMSGLFAWTLVIIFVCFIFEKVFFWLITLLERKILS